MSAEYYDVLIIGAGISGISAAYHLQKNCPDKTYKIIERRSNLGGTWDLFNYPGIRSDSDMYTFGFSFRPWADKSAIASKDKILNYLTDTTKEYGIDSHIQYDTHVKQADWDSKQSLWTFTAEQGEQANPVELQSQYVFMCVGYYDYDHGHNPEFKGVEDFEGNVIHPQFWPEEFDYTDKNIVVVGSGATAVTLVPALSEKAKHVTMLQRSPTYMGVSPAVNPIANFLAKWFGRTVARWWFILSSMFVFNYCRLFPNKAKKTIISEIEKELGDKFEAKHFTPTYKPWDQRVCLCPDGDFFESMRQGKASVVTDTIDCFTDKGIKTNSGEELAADVVVTATGLKMLFAGGIEVSLDGKPVEPYQHYVYKGVMCSDVPNIFIATGYTNASWTLKVDLTNQYACRLINYNTKNGYRYCVPKPESEMHPAPLLDLASGYIQRGEKGFPRQATNTPWKLYQNYIYDKVTLGFTSLDDKQMEFGS